MSRTSVASADIDYVALSMDEVRRGLEALVDDVRLTFGGLDAQQLNWRPDSKRWSVAQCFDHLVSANREMLHAAEAALTGRGPRVPWRRLPFVPGLLGRMLIRSQSPQATRKWTAPPNARPSSSRIDPGILDRFLELQQEAADRLEHLEHQRAAHVIMTSPFVSVVSYSVLDGWRLILAHERRHVRQAEAVLRAPGFPTSQPAL